MTDSQEKNASESQNDQTIRIEIPGTTFESMSRMMSRFFAAETAKSSCCEMPRDACCPQAGYGKNQEFTFVIRRKG